MAKRFNINTNPMAIDTSFELALITEDIVAIAVAPQIAEPAAIIKLCLRGTFTTFPKVRARNKTPTTNNEMTNK